MNVQQIFGKRLEALLSEKNISQNDFAEQIGCSRQSVNFYILGKRTPDIVLAAQMAERLGVSCDYLVGRSNIRQDKIAALSIGQIGLTEEAMRVFAGLHFLAKKELDSDIDNGAMNQLAFDASQTLFLLNNLIAHDDFGILLQYIKRYYDISDGKDTMAILQNFMIEMTSPYTGSVSGSSEENMEMMKDFCLHIASKYFEKIVTDISQSNK